MSNRIKKLRLEKKISQQKLADEIGVTRQAISLFEKGERDPKLETWIKLSNFFKVPVSYLKGISKYRDDPSNFGEIDNFQKFIENIADDKNKRGDLFFTEETWKNEVRQYVTQSDFENFKKMVEFFNTLGIPGITKDKVEKVISNLDEISEVNKITESTFYFFEACMDGVGGDKEKMELVEEFNTRFEKIERERNPDDWWE